MQLVERHIINKHDPRWYAIDQACFLSKSLYNAALYTLRQHFFTTGLTLPYAVLAKQMKTNPDYCALPRKVSQWVLVQVIHDWQTFWSAHYIYQTHPQKFSGRPRLPKYKHPTSGRNVVVYTNQAISRKAFKKGFIEPSQLGVRVKTDQKHVNQVRVVPRKTYYVIEVVYTVKESTSQLSSKRIAALDLGVDNLATVTFNQPGLIPLLINGRPLKSLNHLYNKQRALLQSLLAANQYTSHRLDALTDKRNRRVEAYLHLTSRRLIDTLHLYDIGTLIIGKNDGWKQNINLGDRINQNFVQIPYARFIDMLSYKARLAGIKVVISEESYTSKCSFLDNEPIGKSNLYAGKRVKRWLFVSREGHRIHADVNASYNILRKVIPNAFDARGIAASVVTPVRVTPH